MKKSSIILAVLFAGVLVSCGNNGNTTSSANTKAVQGNATSTTNDNSVTFNEGAIQINLQQGSEADATKLAKMIMEKIKRETQLRNTLNYNAI